jgi:uncharacterized membrane protein (UPF0127 family)
MLLLTSKVGFAGVALLCMSVLFGCAKPTGAGDNQSLRSQATNSSVTIDDESPFDAMSDEEADAWLAVQNGDGKIALSIGDTAIRVEYADTPEKRQLGLMFRRELCDNCGMLFKFDSVRTGSIWMKNTFIPLDLAYIDEAGRIIDIKSLQPHDLTPVKSSSTVLYALEMNQGWFAKQDIRTGDTVSLLP